MKRSAALAPLSRDHHHALVVASVATRADEATARSAALLFADFIRGHEAAHFALEEALLLPALPAGHRGEALAGQVLADHRELRDGARRLARARGRTDIELVHELGAQLRAHVQLEERKLFPYVEQTLDAEALVALGGRIEAAHSAIHAPAPVPPAQETHSQGGRRG
ncbi:MAG: hemerythrin domain-containing protein [Solirubrobacteraceae bacterium]